MAKLKEFQTYSQIILSKPPIPLPNIERNDLSREELIKMRDENFQKVEVKSGDGYTQLMERHLASDLNKLGIQEITPDDKKLAIAVNLSQAMTNLDNFENNSRLNL